MLLTVPTLNMSIPITARDPGILRCEGNKASYSGLPISWKKPKEQCLFQFVGHLKESKVMDRDILILEDSSTLSGKGECVVKQI